MITSFIAGIIIGCILMYLLIRKKNRSSPARGVTDFVEKQHENKQQGKERVLGYLKQNGNITNNDVEKLLVVSDATASRYLTELEEERKIEQVGERGRFVSYKLRGKL